MSDSPNIAISGMTRIVGVVGDPVTHSLSPRLHNAAYRALGLDYVYGAFPVRNGDFKAALDGARALGLVGLSVTTPHKYEAARLADQRSALVDALGAANTIVYQAGMSFADATDGAGLVDDLEQDAELALSGRTVAVLGAGGSAKAIVAALAQQGVTEILVVNRTPARALEAAALAPGRARVVELPETAGASIVINATSVGLGADQAGASVSAGLAAHLHAGQLALDLVYRPARTPFLLRGEQNGAAVRNGLGMLVHQAAHQVQLFTGLAAPLAAMWASVRDQAE